MMVAIVPDAGDVQLVPEDLEWNEDPLADYAATTVEIAAGSSVTATFQATRFVYPADIAEESNHDPFEAGYIKVAYLP